MGEYLSAPNKEKQSEEAENGRVPLTLIIFSFDMQQLECKGGGDLWKMRTSQT
jgi:hypothetical protein